ncbi:helix-turn-helix domain-containing protein [Glutamicibacter sp. AGC84]
MNISLNGSSLLSRTLAIGFDDSIDAPPPDKLTLARGVDILRAIGRGATNLNEVSVAANIGMSAAQRMVKLLVQRGFLRSTHGTDFSLGPELI